MRTTTHSVRRVLALVTLVAALAVPAASAKPLRDAGAYSDPAQADVYSIEPVNPPSTPGSASSAGDGFDWGDAGIGAAAILALAAIGAGAAAAFGYRSGRRHTVA